MVFIYYYKKIVNEDTFARVQSTISSNLLSESGFLSRIVHVKGYFVKKKLICFIYTSHIIPFKPEKVTMKPRPKKRW